MIIPEFVIVAFLCAIFTGSTAKPAVVPKSLLAQVGTAARFNCTAMHDEPVYWAKRPYGSPSAHDIYIGEKFLLDDYGASGRFSVEDDSILRRYDLVIKDIKRSDAGVYTCIDERGLGKMAHAELVVWDMLRCQENQPHDSHMGENVFGLNQDAIGFTCRINFSGNIRPQFKWSVGGKKMNGTQEYETGIASSSLILVATSKLDGAGVTCEVLVPGSPSENTLTGPHWTSDTIHVKYAVLRKEVVKECPGVENSLNCNPPCSYKMETVNETQRCTVSYATGTDVKWLHLLQIKAHTFEADERYWFGMGALSATAGFVLITVVLALGCLIWDRRIRRRMEKVRWIYR